MGGVVFVALLFPAMWVMIKTLDPNASFEHEYRFQSGVWLGLTVILYWLACLFVESGLLPRAVVVRRGGRAGGPDRLRVVTWRSFVGSGAAAGTVGMPFELVVASEEVEALHRRFRLDFELTGWPEVGTARLRIVTGEPERACAQFEERLLAAGVQSVPHRSEGSA